MLLQIEQKLYFTRITGVTEAGKIVHPEGGSCLCGINLQYFTKTAEQRGVGSRCGAISASGAEEAAKAQT